VPIQLIVAMRAIRSLSRVARKQFEDKVDSVVRPRRHIVAKATICPERLCPTTGRHLYSRLS